jgi:hypothetical protein
VKNHGHAIAGYPDIELDAVDPEVQRAAENREGVFQPVGGSAAMGDDQGLSHVWHRRRKSG